ncbi:hypothetical protein [Nocardioides daeguensis]|uniref:hypothetical protein n=1 Tax=Nocardioides daeguensis TaxID=908359 RepID=UPI001C476E74|nr:hypothetical protein [Nocardioides daeguensis]MBV6729497.1 hypothetical protein [Nocardioides daeguensis]MCR1771730.1 hypothetical protein [Nocardioides daeguensis]
MPGLHLTRTAENSDEIDALVAALADDGGGRVGMAGMAPDLPLRLRRTFAPLPRLLGRKVSQAWTWEAADRRDPNWYPQGITTSARTGFREQHGHDVLVTSWYARQSGGSRISVVDLERRRYGHVLLVMPTLTDGRAGFKPLKVHAGGIVWHGDHLHVAATGAGIHSAHVGDVLRVPAGSSYPAFGHRYVLPVRFTQRSGQDDGVERLRYSFLTLDRSQDTPTLVVGEYGSPTQTRRMARFLLDPESGLPRHEHDGRSVPEVDDRGVVRMQGVAAVDGTYYVTRSRGPLKPGSVYVGRPGAFREHRWATPPGPEDLVWWPETGCVWSVSEHPRRRWVFGMRRQDLPA